ncbi:hypothetical protein WJX74_003986 [Apatococcus lobatus]|uniref:Uncharacterized protein n=1 Tax=Apatococcus lobatus TaxID=904363 RepID=A0AAW1Q4G7_9CHLO
MSAWGRPLGAHSSFWGDIFLERKWKASDEMSGRSGEARRLALMQQGLAEDARAEIVGDTRLLNGLLARAEQKDREAAGERDEKRRRLVRRHGDRLWTQAERVERKIEEDNAGFAKSMAALASAEKRAVSSRARPKRRGPEVGAVLRGVRRAWAADGAVRTLSPAETGAGQEAGTGVTATDDTVCEALMAFARFTPDPWPTLRLVIEESAFFSFREKVRLFGVTT